MHFLRFLRKIPSLYTQDKLIDGDRITQYSNKLLIKGDNEIYPIYCPDIINAERKTTEEGILNTGFIRTYNIFLHQASAWYMRKEINNFITFAKKYKISLLILEVLKVFIAPYLLQFIEKIQRFYLLIVLLMKDPILKKYISSINKIVIFLNPNIGK